jgi:hypothetical protein
MIHFRQFFWFFLLFSDNTNGQLGVRDALGSGADPKNVIPFDDVAPGPDTGEGPAMAGGQFSDHIEVTAFAKDHPDVRPVVDIIPQALEKHIEIFALGTAIPGPVGIRGRFFPVIRRVDGDDIEPLPWDLGIEIRVDNVKRGGIVLFILLEAADREGVDVGCGDMGSAAGCEEGNKAATSAQFKKGSAAKRLFLQEAEQEFCAEEKSGVEYARRDLHTDTLIGVGSFRGQVLHQQWPVKAAGYEFYRFVHG